jgi:hypothetical protein
MGRNCRCGSDTGSIQVSTVAAIRKAIVGWANRDRVDHIVVAYQGGRFLRHLADAHYMIRHEIEEILKAVAPRSVGVLYEAHGIYAQVLGEVFSAWRLDRFDSGAVDPTSGGSERG